MIPYGGTFVRPGVIAWDGIMAPGSGRGAGPGYSSCEAIEQAIAGFEQATTIVDASSVESSAMAGADPGRLVGLLAELARARLWLPLPDSAHPVTDGSAVILPVITWVPPGGIPSGAEQGGPGAASPEQAATDFVPAFTSVQRLVAWADPRAMRSAPGGGAGQVRSGDPAWVRDLVTGSGAARHIVVPFPGLAGCLPPGLGIAINPGTSISVRVHPDAVAVFAAEGQPRPGQHPYGTLSAVAGREVLEQGGDGLVEVLAELVAGDVLVIVGEQDEVAYQGAEGAAEADADGGAGADVGEQGGEPSAGVCEARADDGVAGEQGAKRVLVAL
jgi:hypothetical protein